MPHGTILCLKRNMRLQSSTSLNALHNKKFADWILKVGNGDIGDQNDGEDYLQIPTDMLIEDSTDSMINLMDFVYPNFISHSSSPGFFKRGPSLHRQMTASST